MAREFEKVDIEEVRLEHLREVVAALAKHIGVSLWQYDWQDGGRDFEFRAHPNQQDKGS